MAQHRNVWRSVGVTAVTGMAVLATAAPAAGAGVAAATPISFGAPASYPAGERPWAVHTADLNADDHPDIVTVNGVDNQNGSVSVLLNNGDGSYAPAVEHPLGDLGFGVTVADLDGDGDADIAASAGSTRGSVLVLLGDGTGAFQQQERTYSVGYSPNSVAAADLDADGAVDLLTADYFASTVSVLDGNGDGTFAPSRQYDVGPTPQGLRVTDVDGDGHVDVITGGFGQPNASLTILAGNGDGTFDEQRSFAAGESVNDADAADLNGDGIVDAVTGQFVTDQVSVLLGDPDGGLGEPTAIPVNPGVNSIAVADLDGDGAPEIVSSATPVDNRVPTESGAPSGTAPSTAGGFSVLQNNGDATFQPFVLHPIEGSVAAVDVTDVDGDGDLDVVGVLIDSGAAVVWPNTTTS